MVAMSEWGLILTSTWIGGLVLILTAQAVWVWFQFRRAERSAVHARKLLEAIPDQVDPSPEPQPANVIQLPTRRPVPYPVSPRKAQP
jgi:hypothetical protein